MESVNRNFWYIGAGHQEKLFKDVKDGELVVKKINNSRHHCWQITNPSNFIESTKSHTKEMLFEIIHHFPVKIYFDIDGKNPKECNLNIIKPIINKYFNNPKMAISGYETEKKNSYHIVLPELLIKDENDLTSMKKLVLKMKEENDSFDTCVYHVNRAMKCVNQCKPDAERQLILEDDIYENHFITCNINKTSKPFEFEIDYDDNNVKIIDLPKVTPKMKNTFDETIKTITPEQYKNALYNLNLIPNNDQLFNTWQYAHYAKQNGISFNDFWLWAKQKKDTPERFNKYNKLWASINTNSEKAYSLTWCQNKISTLFPNFKNYDDLMTRTFVKSFEIPSVKIPVLVRPTYQTADIKSQHFETKEKVSIFNIGMGGGKTTATVEWLKKTKKTFAWLSVRQTLAKNTDQRFVDEKMDVFNYLADGNTKTKEAKINTARSLLISTESLHYLKDTSKFDVLVIDEIESLLMVWPGKTHDNFRTENFDNFKALFQNCKKVILLDAFTTMKTINFVKSLGINDIITYTCDYKMTERKIIENYHEEDIKNKLINDINANKKVYVFYPFLNKNKSHIGIEDLKAELKSKCNLNDDEIRCYHSMADDKTKKDLSNVKVAWKNAKVILTTSTITVGVNYDGLDFYKVYLFTSGTCNLARDVAQTSLRIRCPSNPDIEMYFFDKQNIDLFEMDKKFEKKDDPIYNSLIGDIKIEKFSDFIPSFKMYAQLSGFKADHIKETKAIQKKATYDITDHKTGETVKCIIAYDDVETITEAQCKKLEIEKIFVYDASMEEKFQVKKHYFDIKFSYISKKDRAFIWNNRLEDNYKNLYHPIVRMIEEDNELRITELKTGFTISDKTKDYMTSKFAEKKDLKNTSTMAIKILSSLIGGISSSKNVLKIDDDLIRLYEISVNNTKNSDLFIED